MTATPVGEGTRLVSGAGSNWVVITEGSDVTLIDTGYPGDLARVEQALAGIGRRVEDVAAILITHAHIDHVGSLPALQRRSGATVYTSEQETHHLAGEYHEVATPLDVARRAYRPSTLRWLRSVVPAGVLKKVTHAGAAPAPPGAALDVPGRPVPVLTPGHTSGHTAYLLPAIGALATGDALVTGHPLLARSGPQLLPAFFTHDQDEAFLALDAMGSLDAEVLLPGHGPVLVMPMAQVVAAARERTG